MRLPLASGSAGRRWVGNWIVGGIGAAVIALAIGNGLGQPVGVQAALFRFGEVEAHVLAKFDDTMQKAQWGALSDAQVSLILDEEIVIPWRAARVEFETMDDVPIQDKPRFDKLIAYMNLRKEAWQLLSQGIKTQNEEMTNSFVETMDEAEQILAEIEKME